MKHFEKLYRLNFMQHTQEFANFSSVANGIFTFLKAAGPVAAFAAAVIKRLPKAPRLKITIKNQRRVTNTDRLEFFFNVVNIGDVDASCEEVTLYFLPRNLMWKERALMLLRKRIEALDELIAYGFPGHIKDIKSGSGSEQFGHIHHAIGPGTIMVVVTTKTKLVFYGVSEIT